MHPITTGQTTTTVSPSLSSTSGTSMSSTSSSGSTTTTTNIDQFHSQHHYPPISTLRRSSRPSNIDLSVFDVNNSPQHQINDPGIYSAPICHLKQSQHHHHHHHHHHVQQLLSPRPPPTATFHYQPQQQQQHQQQQQQQHLHLSHHHHHPNLPSYQQQQQQQQHVFDPFAQHTPHTFPLQTSPNHYHFFHFPPSTQNPTTGSPGGHSTVHQQTPASYNPLQQPFNESLALQVVNVPSNGHHSPLNHRTGSSTNTSQPSTPTHNNRLLAVQMQEQSQQWSNPVLSPLMVKRLNEGGNAPVVSSLNIDDDDEDPSASIDALVADVDSSPHGLLDDQSNKVVDGSKVSSSSSTTPPSPSRANRSSHSPHLYLRGTSHILTTPPNPLASDDHPDNQLSSTNFQKTFSPLHSAGFELSATATSTNNGGVQMTSSVSSSFFTFDNNAMETTTIKSTHNNDVVNHPDDEEEEDSQDKMTKPLIISTDERAAAAATSSSTVPTGQDDNSSPSSTHSGNQTTTTTSSRILSQMLKKSSGEQPRLSPLVSEMKLSKSQTMLSNMDIRPSSSLSLQSHKHICLHPDCNKYFANKSALAKHKLTHCQDRKHKCPKCNKGFKRLDHLHGHMLTHEEEKPHKCRVPDCNRTYCDARSLKRHIENAHQNILAAIHQGGHDELKTYLPETAFVKTKEFLNNNNNGEFSLDSIESNSPRESIDLESQSTTTTTSFNLRQIRTSNGTKLVPTYTFDEEKCVQCQICQRTFKNGAALNGHMRLHGGFNEKQQSPSSVAESTQKKKRLPPAGDRRMPKRKRMNSPSSVSSSHESNSMGGTQRIKSEEQEVMMMTPTSDDDRRTTTLFTQQQQQQSCSIYPTLPPCSDAFAHHFYEKTSPARIRSISSSVVQPQTTPLPHNPIKNPMSVQPLTHTTRHYHRKQVPLPSHTYDKNNNRTLPTSYEVPGMDELSNHRMPIYNSNNNHLNVPLCLSGELRFDSIHNSHLFPPNLVQQQQQQHENKMRKSSSADHEVKFYQNHRQINGSSPRNQMQQQQQPLPHKHHPHYHNFRSHSMQYPNVIPSFHVHSPSSPPPAPTSSFAPNLFHQMLRHSGEYFAKPLYFQPTTTDLITTCEENVRRTPSTSPFTTHQHHSPGDRTGSVPNSTSSVINTPVTSPYSNPIASHHSPLSSSQHTGNSTTGNVMQPSPVTGSSSSSCSSSSSSIAAPKKRFLIAMKQEAHDEQIIQSDNASKPLPPPPPVPLPKPTQTTYDLLPPHPPPLFGPVLSIEETDEIDKQQPVMNSSDDPTPFVLTVVPDVDSPTPVCTSKSTSAFLIGTPLSSTGTNSSSSASSSNVHFNYEHISQPNPLNRSNSSGGLFLWPLQTSQLRRQQSINNGSQTPNTLPSTPYTPPPMLSPFRKGPGLYYRVFSQTTPQVTTPPMQTATTVVTPVLPVTPIGEESLGPKINIGEEYQAKIPKLHSEINLPNDDADELLFSPSQLPHLDEAALEKYEQLSRSNPLLFSPRHSPTLYPLELVYMLLYEYGGDLQRTLAALLEGTATGIKQCRPLHRYRFPECDSWTKEEIDAFTKAMETSEKNFELVSRAVGTKSIKQCIEFHYMPKLSPTTMTNLSSVANGSSLAKRKRQQMIKAKHQQRQMREQLDDETSSSSFNELRLDEDPMTMNSDSSSIGPFSCDIDECAQTFPTERACRAHRNEHRRYKNNVTPPNRRNRYVDANK